MTESELPNWDRIIERHADRVFRVALRILGSVQDAEDVSQDVFTEAFQLHSAGPVRSWIGLLVRLATLRSLDRLRRKKSSAQLPDQQATVFIMFHYEQISREDISATLDISPESVSTALYKARQNLSSQLVTFNQGHSK
jgi:DNA-directed RNA polymerase specialized sigma24 family protein